MTRQSRNQDSLLRLAIPTLVDHPYEHLSLQGVADACGASLWAFRYNFANVERLFRAVAGHLIDEVIRRSKYRAPAGKPVLETIADHAAFLADLFEGEAYRNLLYFVLRNGRHHPWLEKAYDQRIVSRICADIERLVLDSGGRHGVTILMNAGAARRFYKKLETELVLTTLLPAAGNGPPVERDEIIKAAAREAFQATYVFDWQVPTAA